ncbi:MAG: TRAP transporter large permease [Alphaproteobacteria bacterium]|nr:TRAP transporter large permease [Alphaproteobacteria bacterium]
MTFILMLAALIALLYLGMPMFAGMFLFSLGVLYAVEGHVATLGEFVFGKLNVYLLIAIPLFMLMAHVMVRGRVVDDLFGTTHTLLRHVRGGLGVATVLACTVFAAISGSSVATALTIGKVAIPQMLRYGMSRQGAFGVVAAGGTLGILIPPSAPMVLYALVTESSVGALFMAGVGPGIMMAAIFAAYCMATEGRPMALAADGQAVPVARAPVPEMLGAIRRSFWALTLPPFVLGGMYFGIFTATEAAAAGALYAMVIAGLIYRQLRAADFWEGVNEATRTSAMLFMVIIGAGMFGHMLTKLRVPQELVEMVVAWNIGRTGFLVAMMALVFVLGLILESFSIILITTPVIIPVLDTLGIDKVWYGVMLTLNLELALISPPVAMNLVVIKAITGAPLAEVNRSIIPYMLLLSLGIAILIAVPEIALWLPRTMEFST